MFCAKEVTLALNCGCAHGGTKFTNDELYSMYLVMQTISCGKDIFTAFIINLQEITISPTHVHMCIDHRIGWVATKASESKSFCIYDDCDARYIGCVNSRDFLFPYYNKYGNGFKLKHLLHGCYDSDSNNIECPELATYFSKGTTETY